VADFSPTLTDPRFNLNQVFQQHFFKLIFCAANDIAAQNVQKEKLRRIQSTSFQTVTDRFSSARRLSVFSIWVLVWSSCRTQIMNLRRGVAAICGDHVFDGDVPRLSRRIFVEWFSKNYCARSASTFD
jgi:hypothetical protein